MCFCKKVLFWGLLPMIKSMNSSEQDPMQALSYSLAVKGYGSSNSSGEFYEQKKIVKKYNTNRQDFNSFSNIYAQNLLKRKRGLEYERHEESTESISDNNQKKLYYLRNNMIANSSMSSHVSMEKPKKSNQNDEFKDGLVIMAHAVEIIDPQKRLDNLIERLRHRLTNDISQNNLLWRERYFKDKPLSEPVSTSSRYKSNSQMKGELFSIHENASNDNHVYDLAGRISEKKKSGGKIDYPAIQPDRSSKTCFAHVEGHQKTCFILHPSILNEHTYSVISNSGYSTIPTGKEDEMVCNNRVETLIIQPNSNQKEYPTQIEAGHFYPIGDDYQIDTATIGYDWLPQMIDKTGGHEHIYAKTINDTENGPILKPPNTNSSNKTLFNISETTNLDEDLPMDVKYSKSFLVRNMLFAPVKLIVDQTLNSYHQRITIIKDRSRFKKNKIEFPMKNVEDSGPLLVILIFGRINSGARTRLYLIIPKEFQGLKQYKLVFGPYGKYIRIFTDFVLVVFEIFFSKLSNKVLGKNNHPMKLSLSLPDNEIKRKSLKEGFIATHFGRQIYVRFERNLHNKLRFGVFKPYENEEMASVLKKSVFLDEILR